MSENNKSPETGYNYSWKPYQPSQNIQTQVPVLNQPVSTAVQNKENEEIKAKDKKGVPAAVLWSLCTVLSILLVFVAAWTASSVAYQLSAQQQSAAEQPGTSDPGHQVVIGQGTTIIRSDAAELQNSQYDTLSEMVEDVTKSLVTLYNEVDYCTAAIVGEDDKYIYLTAAYHFLASSSSVKAIIGEDTSKLYTPLLQGTNMDTDLAVVKIAKSDIEEDVMKKMKIGVFGDSDSMELGDLAIAFSSPMGYFNTPSLGTISGLERGVTFSLSSQNISINMIQTDAAANTSGILFNGRGEIIGLTVNMTIEDSEGISFAVPSSIMKEVVAEIIEKGYVTTPYMGFTGYNVLSFYPNGSKQSWAEYYQLPAGILVKDIVEGSPAEQAGLAQYDVIVGFNGQQIQNFDDLKIWLDECEVGQVVTVEVIRGYINGEAENVELTLTVGQKPQ